MDQAIGRVYVEHEGINIRAKLSHDERHPLGHQARNEGDIARQAIKLRNEHGAFQLFRHGQGGGQLRAAAKRVGPLASFDLPELGRDFVPVIVGKLLACHPLSGQSQTRLALAICTYSIVDYDRFHLNTRKSTFTVYNIFTMTTYYKSILSIYFIILT